MEQFYTQMFLHYKYTKPFMPEVFSYRFEFVWDLPYHTAYKFDAICLLMLLRFNKTIYVSC